MKCFILRFKESVRKNEFLRVFVIIGITAFIFCLAYYMGPYVGEDKKNESIKLYSSEAAYQHQSLFY